MPKDLILTVYACSTAAALAMLVMGICARRARNSLYFTLLSLAIFIRSLGYLFELMSLSLDSAIAATQVQYFGGPFIAPFFLLFALEYCGIKVRKRLAIPVMVIPVAACLQMLTYPLNGVYYENARFIQSHSISHLAVEGSVFHTVFETYNELLPIVSIGVLGYFFWRRDRVFKRQAAVVVLASLSPAIVAVCLLAHYPLIAGLDLSPVALGLTCLSVGYSFLKFDFMRSASVAREQTVEAMNNGYILIDMKGAFQDANAAAKSIFPALSALSVGARLTEAQGLAWLAESAGARGGSFELAGPDGVSRHYQISETVVKFASRATGRCIILFDVTEQTNLRQKTEDALAEAENANRSKSAFLANMSHEIRTPMNAILGVSEILVQDETLPLGIMEGLTKIHASSGLLLGIINDILDFSKIEAGKLDVTPASYEIASIVNDTVQLNVMRIGDKPIVFHLEIDENTPAKLVGDELRIKQILNNLLSNAFKYTDSGTVTLRVGFERGGEKVVTLLLEVQDTGHGMTQQQIGKLFDEYSRFQSAATRTIEGTGLGMAITQRLVRLMDGGIQLESEPGRGSLFTVSLPQKTVDAEVLGAELAESLRNFKMDLVTSREKTRIVRDPMPYGRVLVVDDVETNIYVAMGLLKLYGLQISTASSGVEAIENIKAGNVYDVVFMDHMMPVMDGIETTKRLRELGYKEPIVALTANAVAKQADLFLQNGFDGFIAKPIDTRQLGALLNRLVRDKQPPDVIAAARGKAAREKPEAGPALRASFLRDARKAVDVLEDWQLDEGAQTGEGLRLFTITVHNMKSAFANIGEAELSAAAEELELYGKANDIAAIRQSAPVFLDALRALVQKADAVENSDGTEEDNPLLIEKLKAVREMCEGFDRKGITDILTELGQKRYARQTRETLDRILEAALHSAFEEAAVITENLAANLAASLPAPVLIDGLDIDRGVEKFDGDRETYYKILRSYAASLDRLLGVASVISEENLLDYKIAVHGIKGASRDIFASALGETAAGLEDAAKEGNLAYIRQHHQAFDAAARKLASEILEMLDTLGANTPKTKKDKPDAGILAKLLAACEMYDMDGVDAAIAEIGQYEYESDGGLSGWLQEMAEVTDFAAIAQKLAVYQ